MKNRLLFYAGLFGTALSFSINTLAAMPQSGQNGTGYDDNTSGTYVLNPDTSNYPEPEILPEHGNDNMLMETTSESIVLMPIAEEPTIQITVPSDGKIIINPYHIKLPVEGKDVTEEIIHIPQWIVNHSNVPVQINVSAIGYTTGEAQLVSDDPSGDGKELFLYAEFQESDEDGSCYWSDTYEDNDNQLLILETETRKSDVLTLEAGDETPSYGVFRVNGCASISDHSMWTDEDSVSLRLVFTFQDILEA